MKNSDLRKMFVRHCNIQRIALRVDGYGAFHADTQALFEMWSSGYAHGRGDGFIPSPSPAEAFYDFVTEDMT
jgi:hypothetical protein